MLRRLAFALLAVACSDGWSQTSNTPPIRVVATFTILADWVQVVGGEEVQVHSLVGPDSDAHVYEPSPDDIRRVARADALVTNGLGFEGWIDRLRQAAQFRGKLIVASAGIQPRRSGSSFDPHAWQDLRNARMYVLNIASGLSSIRTSESGLFAGRAISYVHRLDELDADFRRAFEPIPADRRIIITSHDAFGYMGTAYGLTLLPAQGLSTDSEPTASQVANLIRQIRAARVSAVFVENIRDARMVERIAKEGGAVIGGRLFSDALGKPSSGAASYIDMYQHNVTVLLHALRNGSVNASDTVR